MDKNKIFAMVVYKNYYPNEFSKLNSNNGEIYNIFYKEKIEVVDKLIEDKEKEIVELYSRKNEIVKESLVSIDQVNSIYAYTILRKLEPFQRVNYNNVSLIQIESNSKVYNINDISTTEVLKEIVKYQDINLKVTNSNFSINFKFKDIENEVDSERKYIDRLSSIIDKESGELSRISNKIFEINNEVQNIKNQKFVELLKKTDIIINKPILGFFVKNGFIDETYQDYISYFFEESISLNDKNYAILVNSFDEPNFELELKKCDELIKTYLGLDKLSTHSALNFSMLDFLLNNINKKIYLDQYTNVVCDGSSISTDFLKRYFRREKNLSLLIPKIVDLREIIIDDMDISDGTKEALINFKNFIKYVPFNRYQELPYLKEEFRRELSSTGNYVEFILECFDGDFDRFKAFTDAVHPTLECTTFSPEQVKELNWLGENSYLAINKHMIDQVLINNSDKPEDIIANLEVKPVTLMANSGIDYLIENIWSENLLEYIRVILLGTDEHTLYSEDEDVYIKALNMFDNRNSIVERFIRVTSTKIKDISTIKNYQIQQYLMSSLKVQYSWSNVFRYFSESYEDQDDQGAYREIDSSLVKFLESGQEHLRIADDIEPSIIDIEDWKGTKAEFDKHLFICNELSDEAYEKLIGITDNNWDNSSLENVNQKKIQTLISLGKLSLTPENWEQVKEYASKEIILAFLVKHHQTVIDDLDSIELRPKDIEALFCSDEISNEYKEVLAESKAIDLIETNIAVRKEVIKIYEDKKMASPVYDQLLKYADSEELKKLLLKQAKYLDKQEILKILKLLDEPYQKLANGQEVEFENNNENNDLIHELNVNQIVMRVPKPTRPKGNPVGKKVLSTRLQIHVLSN